jgi:Uma2 family endonuclease
MATAAQTPYLSVEEYLKTSFRPDVDYVDGFIEERNLGEWDHSTLQHVFSRIFDRHRKDWNISIRPELRTQTSSHRFRVPDVCVMNARHPKEQIVRTAPLLCVEILSPEDTFPRMRERIKDFLTMGVPQVWIVDPQHRTATVCSSNADDTVHSTGVLTLPNTLIAVDLEEVFAALDED